MKKILSIVIAAAMLLAISVPAFAATATIDQSTSGGVGNSSVVTDRSGISGTFTVSYPAETTIIGAPKVPKSVTLYRVRL